MHLPFFKQIERLSGPFVLFALLSALDAKSQSECGPGTYWDASVSLCLPSNNCPADINDDGQVAVNDLLLLLSAYSDVCPCEVDSDGDGVCDEEEVLGCVDVQACNYFIDATEDDGTCVYPGSNCNVGGANGYYGVYDNDCTCQDLGLLQVTFNVNMETEDVAPSGVYLAGYGEFGNPGDNPMTDDDGDGIYSITVEVEAGFSSYYVFTNGACGDWSCKEWLDGLPCGDPNNYDFRFLPQVTSNTIVNTCFGQCSTDGTCIIYGCVDSQACNFDEGANADDASCEYPPEFYNCDGVCIADSDGDGICDELEILGCTFGAADNFDPLANEDDGSCEVPGCIISIACNYNPSATYDDGSCFFYCPGCTSQDACNYDALAIQDDGSCLSPAMICGAPHLNCDCICVNDTDADGICDEDEVLGCMESGACNYLEASTDDNGSCEFETCSGCMYEFACNYDPEATIAANETCEFATCAGCTDPEACNYNPSLVEDDGSCDYSCIGCTDIAACNYAPEATDDDGSCDYSSCAGCTDMAACNYAPAATDDDGSCDYSSCGCTDSAACNYAPEAIDDDGSCDYSCMGCTDAAACNYAPEAAVDDGSCDYSCIGCTDAAACNYAPEAAVDDGSCDYSSCGCTVAAACNYAPEATDDDGSCFYTIDSNHNCDGTCLNDGNGDGVCDCDGESYFDGYTYDLVAVGDQCWFAENLRNAHYANGDEIPGELSDNEWQSTTQGAMTIYGEGTSIVETNLYSTMASYDEVVALSDYGRLYNWYAVDDSRGLCPSGWHVPSDWEYVTLEMELGMSLFEANTEGYRGTQGNQMKASVSDTPSWDGTNTSGFSGLGGGVRSYDASFEFENVIGYFWTSSLDSTSPWYRMLSLGYNDIGRHSPNLAGYTYDAYCIGFSVRCVRD